MHHCEQLAYAPLNSFITIIVMQVTYSHLLKAFYQLPPNLYQWELAINFSKALFIY